MTPEQASIALGVPLVYYSGRAGSEIYVAYGSPGIPGFYPVDSALALQFRKGQLTGWKKDWRLRRPWTFLRAHAGTAHRLPFRSHSVPSRPRLHRLVLPST